MVKGKTITIMIAFISVAGTLMKGVTYLISNENPNEKTISLMIKSA